MNNPLLLVCGVVAAVLVGALTVQTVRVAGLKTDLAVTRADLREAETHVALLEEDAKALAGARDGLAAQVEACQQAAAWARDAAADRADILKNAKTTPAKPGEVVDDATSARAARHINDAAR